jgi:D-arabinitol 2-dehydrogenase
VFIEGSINMFKHNNLRQLSRASATAIRPPTFRPAFVKSFQSPFSTNVPRREKDDQGRELDEYTTSGELGAFEHEGQHSRTDNTIRVEYPEEADLPRQQPVQGRGGFHFKRTLASFSLEDRVGVVTGGARGLGLVMSQALVISGADVAIVDLNRMCNLTNRTYKTS